MLGKVTPRILYLESYFPCFRRTYVVLLCLVDCDGFLARSQRSKRISPTGTAATW
jgi:hypothetical protein